MQATSWRKSSRGNSTDDQNCVEARSFAGRYQVRDSKPGEDSPVFDLVLRPPADRHPRLTTARTPPAPAMPGPRWYTATRCLLTSVESIRNREAATASPRIA